MAPILIDKRDLLKLAVISVLSIVLAFSGGYLFGFKQAALNVTPQSDGEIFGGQSHSESNYSVPEVTDTDVDESIIVSQIVNQDDAIERAELAVRQMANESAEVEATEAEPAAAVPEIVSTKDTVKNNNAKEESSVTVNSDADKFYINSGQDRSQGRSNSSGSSSRSENSINFTIQIAVYGDLKNAESMMLSLQEKNLDAYVSGYTTKSNKRRFNVRLGYFQNKKMALSALKIYIDKHQGDGYLVNFSAKNIVSFAKKSVVQVKHGNSAE